MNSTACDLSILVNLSNVKYGGGLQVATSLIHSLANDNRGCTLYFLVSENIYQQIRKMDLGGINIKVITLSPFNFWSILKVNWLIFRLSKKYNLDAIFSLFGPSFVFSHKKPHLEGIANAWLFTADKRLYSIFPKHKGLLVKAKNWILHFFLRGKNKTYVTETQTLKNKIVFSLGVSDKSVFVVSNTLSPFFEQLSFSKNYSFLRELKSFKFLTVAKNYPHKNLDTISKVGKILEDKGFDFVFVVTFSEEEYFETSPEFQKYTLNVGVVDVSDCPGLYYECDALFLPTLIECFTVSYLEAMKFKMPILTSDRSFAKEICLDVGYYFDPYDEGDIAAVLELLLTSNYEMVVNDIVAKYSSILSKFGNNEDRVNSYIKILGNIISGGDRIV